MVQQNRNDVRLTKAVEYNGHAILKVLRAVIGETETDTMYKVILDDGTLADVPAALIDAAGEV